MWRCLDLSPLIPHLFVSHTFFLYLCPPPVFSFTLWSFCLAARQVCKTNPPCRHQIGSGSFCLSSPVRLLLVQRRHLRALSISITGGKTGLIWSLDLKETSSPLRSFPLLRISWNSLFVLDYVLCAILRSLLDHLCGGVFCNHLCLLAANSIPLCCSFTNRLLDSEVHSIHYSPKVLLSLKAFCPADHWWKHQSYYLQCFFFSKFQLCLWLSGNKDQNSLCFSTWLNYS